MQKNEPTAARLPHPFCSDRAAFGRSSTPTKAAEPCRVDWQGVRWGAKSAMPRFHFLKAARNAFFFVPFFLQRCRALIRTANYPWRNIHFYVLLFFSGGPSHWETNPSNRGHGAYKIQPRPILYLPSMELRKRHNNKLCGQPRQFFSKKKRKNNT